nr:integrase, catalytic region, zinc finger, CCHC-type, peptidase aspartic, catalytic [Tanacetum cinerariifolium]
MNTQCESDTLDPLSQKLDDENVSIEFQFIPKVVVNNDLTKPVTSHSVPKTQESKVVKNNNVISPRMFMINTLKNSREDNFVPNKQVKVGVESTTKTRRPQPRSKTKNDRVIEICLRCFDSGCSKHMTENLKLLINFVWKFMGTVRFGNDHVVGILGFGDLQWKNILITRVYLVEGLGHNLFLVGQFCDSDLEVAFRRNIRFVRNLEGVDLLKGIRSINLYTIKLHEMTSASPICLMACATSTKSWLWHQRLSHLNFDIINDLAKDNLITGLPKFKYMKDHLCPLCEQGKSKKAPHKPNLFQILKRVERRNQKLVEAARTMLIFSCVPLFLWAEAIANACYTQNRSLIHRRFNKTPYELINEIKPDISFLHVFRALRYPKNDREDIGKLGVKAMAFKQRSSKPELQGMFSGYISSRLGLTYSSSKITSQKPTKRELYLLFEAMYDDYIGGKPSTTTRTAPAAPAPQALTIPNTLPDVDEKQQQHVNQQDGEMCIYALSVSTIEPSNVKEAMIDPGWIDLIQDELLQFKRLDV